MAKQNLYSRFSVFLFIFSLTNCSTNLSNDRELQVSLKEFPQTNLSPNEFARTKLLDSGVNPQFVNLLEKKYTKSISTSPERDKIIQMNVLGFLNPGDYSKHFSQNAVKNIKLFLKKYSKSLSRAEDQFNIPKEVIASLLWVETRHGKMVGSFRMPAVFLSLIQASHPEVAKTTLKVLNDRKPSSNSSASKLSLRELHQKVVTRIHSKSNWAVEQVKAMQNIYFNGFKNTKSSFILNSPSSFAGAFGCSQFIPSSYEKYAVSNKSESHPDLFNLKDCIFSVGNFLKNHGWKAEDPASYNAALFEYNRIKDYGDVILRLAEAVKET